jgi:predicted small lipoprotein YifL
MKRLMLICAVVAPLAVTAACGQKGALYLPPKHGTVVTRPAGSEANTPSNPAQTTGSERPDDKDKDKSQQQQSTPK